MNHTSSLTTPLKTPLLPSSFTNNPTSTLFHPPYAQVRRVMEKGYGVDFYAGDEDNGEQGAW